MKNGLRLPVIGVLSLCLVSLGVLTVHGTSVEKMNVAALCHHGSLVVVGTVVSIADGFDANNLPYTEVTVNVSQAIRGDANGNYTFRQFGLLAPRDLADGRRYLGVSPEGWPTFKVDEEVMLFLFETTPLGFQSTVGLFQGKFHVEAGTVVNAINNRGLFADVSVDPSLLSEAEAEMLTMEKGAVPAATFISFVNKAVQNNWFE